MQPLRMHDHWPWIGSCRWLLLLRSLRQAKRAPGAYRSGFLSGTRVAEASDMRSRLVVPGLAVLVVLALLDLISTLWWHSRGMMTEFNPLMRPLLEKSEWLFSGVKLLTLAALAAAPVRAGVCSRQP